MVGQPQAFRKREAEQTRQGPILPPSEAGRAETWAWACVDLAPSVTPGPEPERGCFPSVATRWG